jgi:hypothetical protein
MTATTFSTRSAVSRFRLRSVIERRSELRKENAYPECRQKICRLIAPLVLSAEERVYLETQFVVAVLLGRYLNDVASFCDSRTAWRARIGGAELSYHEHTVGKWRARFLEDRCDGLLDEIRPSQLRTIDDDQIAAVIERSCAPRRSMQRTGRSA